MRKREIKKGREGGFLINLFRPLKSGEKVGGEGEARMEGGREIFPPSPYETGEMCCSSSQGEDAVDALTKLRVEER